MYFGPSTSEATEALEQITLGVPPWELPMAQACYAAGSGALWHRLISTGEKQSREQVC